MTKKIKESSVVIIAFLLAYYGRVVFELFFGHYLSFTSSWVKLFYVYIWWVVPVVIVALLFFDKKEALAGLGLKGNFWRDIALAFVITLPMLLSSAISGDLISEFSTAQLVKSTLVAGFLEELLFRGFLFGLLFRRCGWGFIPAVVLSALIFGMGHLYQGVTFTQTLGVFIVTLSGGAWFAWLYIEWNRSLWLPIGLHIFMNSSWILFSTSDTALGGVMANVFRAITITISILLVVFTRKQRGGLSINRQNLFISKGY